MHYLVRIHEPGNPYDLTSLPFIIDPEVTSFFIPADENSMVQAMYTRDIIRSSRLSTYHEKRRAACYKHKLETIYMYENHWYRPRNFF